MTYRNELDAITARKAALEDEVRARTRELGEVSRLVDELEARARLPVLDRIKVAAPCAASWDAMEGDARVRACGDCQKNVYNLSELTRDEAEALIRDHEGELCVRYFQRADGTILTADCQVGVSRRRRRRFVAAGVAASLAGAALGFAKSSTATCPTGGDQTTIGALRLPINEPVIEPVVEPVSEPDHRLVMGRMAVRPAVEPVEPTPPADPAPPAGTQR